MQDLRGTTAILQLRVWDYFCCLQEGIFIKSHWLTGKEGYNFQVNLDVCMFIPKKVRHLDGFCEYSGIKVTFRTGIKRPEYRRSDWWK